MSRIKYKSPTLKTRSDAEECVREITETILSKNSMQTEMDEAITAIRTGYEASMAAADKRIMELTEQIRAWADANPSEFGGLKSLDLVHAMIGYRSGMPQLKTLTGVKWDDVTERLRHLASNYIRVKEDVNKQAIIADRDIIGPEGLRAMGVRVIQDETFYVDPKIQVQEKRQEAA